MGPRRGRISPRRALRRARVGARYSGPQDRTLSERYEKVVAFGEAALARSGRHPWAMSSLANSLAALGENPKMPKRSTGEFVILAKRSQEARANFKAITSWVQNLPFTSTSEEQSH